MLGEWEHGEAALLEQGQETLDELADELSRASAGSVSRSDRRLEPRFEAADERLWIEWREGDNFYGRAARLVNVSRRGAMVVATVPLRAGQNLRIYLEEPAPQDAVFATVVGILEGRRGVHQLRLHFMTPCPDSFIEAAALGLEQWLARGRLTG